MNLEGGEQYYLINVYDQLTQSNSRITGIFFWNDVRLRNVDKREKLGFVNKN